MLTNGSRLGRTDHDLFIYLQVDHLVPHLPAVARGWLYRICIEYSRYIQLEKQMLIFVHRADHTGDNRQHELLIDHIQYLVPVYKIGNTRICLERSRSWSDNDLYMICR